MYSLIVKHLPAYLMRLLSTFTVLLFFTVCAPEENQGGKNEPKDEDPKENPGTETEEDVWKQFTEQDIIFQGNLPDTELMSFTGIDGSPLYVVGYPGLLSVSFTPATPVKTVWEHVINASGKVVGQYPELGYYVVSVKAGKENDFVARMKDASGIRSIYPEFEIGEDACFVIDKGQHGRNVENQLNKWDDYVWTEFVDISHGQDASQSIPFETIKHPLFSCLKRGDCEIVNLSYGTPYGIKGKKYGSDQKQDSAYVNNRADYIDWICDIVIQSGNTTTPVILSAGNDGMHELEKIIKKTNKNSKSLLGKQVILVGAKDDKAPTYSNSMNNREPQSPVINPIVDITDIRDVDDPNILIHGTSFAAPNYVRYLRAVAVYFELTLMEAVELLSDEWVNREITAWDDDQILRLCLGTPSTDILIEDIPQKVPPHGGSFQIDVEISAENWMAADSTPWTISADCDWIHFDQTTGTGNERITMTVDGNVTGRSRSATVFAEIDDAQDGDQKKRFKATIEQDEAKVFAPNHDLYYVLPGVESSAVYYGNGWSSSFSDLEFSIDFKTNYKVTECFLEDDTIEHTLNGYYGSYPDENGYYDNSVIVYFSPQTPIQNNCGTNWREMGLRPESPIPSRSTYLKVRLPESPDKSYVATLAKVVQVGLPCITMKQCHLNDVSIPSGVDMEGQFVLDFEVTYPDELTKSACKGLGFQWSSKEKYILQNEDMGIQMQGYGGTISIPVSQSSLTLSFMQFPLSSRTFDWTVDMYVEMYGPDTTERIYAPEPANISMTF